MLCPEPLEPLADFGQADRQWRTVTGCGLARLATQKHNNRDFADVKGLRNSNDNYLCNNVGSDSASQPGFRPRVAVLKVHLAALERLSFSRVTSL